MNLEEFKTRLATITTATSATGIKYHSIFIHNNSVKFKRPGKQKEEKIKIQELYSLYSNETHINTIIAKKHISGRVQSPSVAILAQLGKNQTAKFVSSTAPIPYKTPRTAQKKTTEKDEVKFFYALQELLGGEYFRSKSIQKPVGSSDVHLSGDYKKSNLPSRLTKAFEQLLKGLCSDGRLPSTKMAHHIDGVIVNHPVLRTRIVEFDEEQHFTPARQETISYLINVQNQPFYKEHLEICIDLNYLNNRVLKKHRITESLVETPKSFNEFILWLKKKDCSPSGYINSKPGFPFLGGRIAQRAYYDSLRDIAHLSPKNKGFSPILRFAKKTFEDRYKCPFSQLQKTQIKQGITWILKETYDCELPEG